MTAALGALLAFLCLQLGIGIYLSKRIRSEADYLIGGRSLGYTLATFSLFATWFGAETVIGSSSSIYGEGFSLASPEPFGYGLCLILMGAFLARPLWNRGLTTLADLYRQRFGTGVERLAAVLLIPSSVLWAGAQIRAFGQVLATASLLTPEVGIAIAAVFVVAYSMFGGLLADAVTDVLQGLILTVGLVITLVAVVLRVGGPAEAMHLLATTERVDLAPSAAGPIWLALEAWAIPVIGSLTATEIVSRVIATRTAAIAQRSSLAAGALYILIGSIPVVIALLAGALTTDLAHPEQLLPTVARDSLPPVLFAVFAGGLIAAILSTVDSTLLVASGLLSHNLIVPLAGVTDEAAKVRLARGGVLAFGLVAWFLALHSDGVFALVEQASALGSSGVVVSVGFGLFTRAGSPRTAAMTLCAGAGVYAVASLTNHPTPFLLSLGCALGAWTLGWLIDIARR
ncbi:MAG: sodium:solute symporter family protein [Gemmatimonadetes bacterium]|nr:sodium:solute symporter family protein [Gemmatimonadota bacterium]